jgi:hypothetical protein
VVDVNQQITDRSNSRPWSLIGYQQSPVLTIPKLVLQTTTLITYLREGFPLVVIFSYSGLLLINWNFAGCRFVSTRTDPRKVRTRFFNRHVRAVFLDDVAS